MGRVVKIFAPKKAPKPQIQAPQKAPVERAPNLPQTLSVNKPMEVVSSAPITKETLSLVDKIVDSIKNLIGTLSSAGAFLLMTRQLKENKKRKRAARSSST